MRKPVRTAQLRDVHGGKGAAPTLARVDETATTEASTPAAADPDVVLMELAAAHEWSHRHRDVSGG